MFDIEYDTICSINLFHIVNWYVPCGFQVADMEIQIKSLEQTVAGADAKRQVAEEKLIDLENQVTTRSKDQ